MASHELVVDGLRASVEGREILQGVDLVVRSGEVHAVMGPNGSGKSTFLRTVLGEVPPLDGELSLGDGVQVGYFAQAHDQLVPERRVIDELWARRRLNETEARGYLAHYLFRGDDVFKRVGELSGGERGRLALALLALEGANFLLLDEPTNHLDIPSQEVLQEVLEGFNGTILLVSHDRYLVDRLAQHIWSIEDGELLTFAATYQNFVAERDGAPSAGAAPPAAPIAPPAPETEPLPAPTGWSRDARRRGERRRRALATELEDAEFWLAKMADTLEEARATAGEDIALPDIEAEYAAAQERVDELNREWELLE